MNNKVSPDLRKKKNEKLMENLNNNLKSSNKIFKDLKRKVGYTYWITIILYIFLFALGWALLSVPLYYAFMGDIAAYNSIISGTLGITDLVVLFLFKPVERIHNIMGDISQLTIITTSFQEQVSLRLIAMNVNEDKSVGNAADMIEKATGNSMDLIEKYFESQSED